MSDNASAIIKHYISEVSTTLEKLPVEKIVQVVKLLDDTRLKAKRVFIFGNGGSSATASHFASDLAKSANCSGKPRLKAFALTDNACLFSAWANDTSYDNVFAEQLENFVESGDVVIGISGSGNSSNVLNGMKVARAKGAATIGFIGFDGGNLKEMVDIAVIVPGQNMEQAEDMHLLVEHVITTCLRRGV